MAHIAMLVTNSYEPDPRVQKEASSLVHAGHSVIVYAFDRAHEDLPSKETIDGVHIHRLRGQKTGYGNPIQYFFALREYAALIKRNLQQHPPDVVHCHDQDTCSLGLWWKRHAKPSKHPKFVFDAHDLYWTHATRAKRNLAWKLLESQLRKRDKRFAQACDLLITTTERVSTHRGFAEFYKEWGCDPVVVWNAPYAPVEIPAWPEKFTLGYFGKVRYVEPFSNILQALEMLPEHKRPVLRVAGSGTKQQEVTKLLNNAATSLNLKTMITGSFDFRDLPTLMSECSVQYCMYPFGTVNMEHALPVKLQDSVAYGRPVIANKDCLMGDWVEHHACGWQVTPGSVEELANAISIAYDQYKQLGKQLQEKSKDISWDPQHKTLVNAYDKLLSS